MYKSPITTLNKKQRDAVYTTDGPVLVLAGAGTGKTTVLTSRIAHIIRDKDVPAWKVFAVTFTNKAANEMRERILSELGEETAQGITIGTFHSIAARILRKHAPKIGLTNNFSIISPLERFKIANEIIDDHSIDKSKYGATYLLTQVSKLKDKGVFSHEDIEDLQTQETECLSLFYKSYQSQLKSLDSVDFGDLLLYNMVLFEDPEILSYYKRKFLYILVDEYQDTNAIQQKWLESLIDTHQNICCVGDDDQSIYSWRGSEIKNILNFDKTFHGAKIIKLEENYRSTQPILKNAESLISYNTQRHHKKLKAQNQDSNLVNITEYDNNKAEVLGIIEKIHNLRRAAGINLSSVAILIRAGYQARIIEECLMKAKPAMPYQIIGGMKFYDRKEIRDAISYLRFIINDRDLLAFERIVTAKKCGVGKMTISLIRQRILDKGCKVQEAISQLVGVQIKGRANGALTTLMKKFETLRESNKNGASAYSVATDALDQYIQSYNDGTEESKERYANLNELISNIKEFDTIKDYLSHISLISDTDSAEKGDALSVMTIHAAKGLEFDTVFLVNWDDQSFPSPKSIEQDSISKTDAAIEEERRLAYVAITRAKTRLYISYAMSKYMYGNYIDCTKSRFIDELDQEYCNTTRVSQYIKREIW